jgi:hypothetical protein
VGVGVGVGVGLGVGVGVGVGSTTTGCAGTTGTTGVTVTNEVRSGITAEEATEGNEEPIALIASTVNVYGVPFVRPVTVIGDEVPEKT